MIATQITVNIENKPGQLSAVSDALGDDGINVKALTAAIHGKEASIHMVVDDSDRAAETLKSKGYKLSREKVLAVVAPDHPGGLNAVLKPLRLAGINVEYLYPAIGKSGANAVLILGADPIGEAEAALKKEYIEILDEELFDL